MIKIPVTLQIAVLTVALTGFYMMVGQAVPQKEVHPPAVVAISKDITTDQMVVLGKQIFEGKGICNTCHTIGKSGALRFPDLDGIATRAGTRIAGVEAIDYLAQSLYHPGDFIVPGFNPGMPAVNKPPIGLTDDEILTVIAYLQSLGGTPSVTMQTKLAAAGG
jgi:mono/diheme cytochrome c family protein